MSKKESLNLLLQNLEDSEIISIFVLDCIKNERYGTEENNP
jgi:hypothetical protein